MALSYLLPKPAPKEDDTALWEDIPESMNEEDVASLAHIQSIHQRLIQEQKYQNWKDVLEILFPIYLHLNNLTANWTLPPALDNHSGLLCNCPLGTQTAKNESILNSALALQTLHFCSQMDTFLTLKRKIIHAVATKVESERAVYRILQAQNPHQSGKKYTEDFLQAQWQQQRHFEINIKTADREKQEQQAQFYERDEALKTLAKDGQRNLKIQGETQPLRDSKSRGERLGTVLKEKIFEALGRRRKTVVKVLNTFCNRRKDYLTKYAPDQLGLPENRAITYDEFTKLQLDDPFWNDAYLSFSKDPWAVDPTVQTGIHALLRMDCANEELVQLTNELRRCVSWGIHL
ncbi:hypothetical protein PCASD_14902 [Puccinia coronata f. sp. avenae]|uniref:CxC1-like cysteine cluster associated with KDZ transposases domain-containing protein n=1 Tax=Puccinia coronata f. sp. avenae TaxID=200324 RepID=A0A2N5U5H8_9BASI|nr:hypothetical protein PCASD_14902 [Puccinia coronata f. sp. avenae]